METNKQTKPKNTSNLVCHQQTCPKEWLTEVLKTNIQNKTKKIDNRRKLRTLERQVQWNGTPGGKDDK